MDPSSPPFSPHSPSSTRPAIPLSPNLNSVTPCVHRFILILISHSHAPPLVPQPSLKFDVRNLPNPPKHIRDAQNGTSKRLQEWLLAEPEFVEKRDAMKDEILRGMKRLVEMSEDREHGSEDSEESKMQDEDGEEFRVGISCAMGRHRSVALVEQLAKMSWLEGWEVRVEHRDLGKKRGEGKKSASKGRGSRRMRGSEMSAMFDEDLK